MKNKSKKGFTLVELIVVVALLAIVGVAVISIMTPASNMFTKMQKQAQAKIIASGVMQVIEPQVRFGTNLKIVSAKSLDSNRYLYTTGGKVYIVKGETGNTSPVDLFGTDFYSGYTIEMQCKVPDSSPNTVQITVTAKYITDTSIISSLTTSIQNQNTDTVIDNGGSINYLCYQWLTEPST
jgi:prepilin-type N-terminal cleavage/methylation domain-containing protein